MWRHPGWAPNFRQKSTTSQANSNSRSRVSHGGSLSMSKTGLQQLDHSHFVLSPVPFFPSSFCLFPFAFFFFLFAFCLWPFAFSLFTSPPCREAPRTTLESTHAPR